jgi:hypothetical protein
MMRGVFNAFYDGVMMSKEDSESIQRKKKGVSVLWICLCEVDQVVRQIELSGLRLQDCARETPLMNET